MNISEETTQAMDRIAKWISRLAKYYHDLENGELEIF